MFPRRPLSRLQRTALGAVIGLAVVAPAPAAAAPGDAIIDPNSPSGTEYDLPLDRARDEASGGSVGGRDSNRGGGSGSGGSGSGGSGGGGGASASGGGSAGAAAAAIGGRAPLFGVGLAAAGESVDRGSDANGGGGPGDGSGGKGSPSRDGSPLAQAGEAVRRAEDAAARSAGPGDNNSARTWLAALVAAILAAGGLVGFVVRRASRRTGTPSYSA